MILASVPACSQRRPRHLLAFGERVQVVLVGEVVLEYDAQVRSELLYLFLDDHHELHLEPAVREAISLAEPIAPLCRSDCPGLCDTCGATFLR